MFDLEQSITEWRQSKCAAGIKSACCSCTNWKAIYARKLSGKWEIRIERATSY